MAVLGVNADHAPRAGRARSAVEQVTGTPSADALVSRYLPLVAHLVAECRPVVSPRVRTEDLRSAGLTGLVRAAAGFDPASEASFRRHAEPIIRAALVEQVRDDHRRAAAVATYATSAEGRAEADLATALGRAPTADEVSAFAAGAQDTATVDHGDYVHAAMAAVPEPLRTVIAMYFLNGASMADIARHLRVPESQVAEWRGQALTALRSAMAAATSGTAVESGDAGVVGGRPASYAERALLSQVAALRATRQQATATVRRAG